MRPFSPLAGVLGFEPLPIFVLIMIALVVLLYVGTAAIAKRTFYRLVQS